MRTLLTPGPPLSGGTNVPTEVLFPPGMTSDERVLVGVDSTGKPLSVAVVQHLMLHKLGDYSFIVQGPISDVEAAPGSDSEPGLRHDALLWSGFSSGKKTLAARATLRAAATAPLLPLRVAVVREGDTLVLRGENVSSAPGPVLLGPAAALAVARALDNTRSHLSLGRSAPDEYVTVPRTPLSQSEPIASPLDVQGELAGTRFRYTLGDGRPMRFERRFPNAPTGAKLRLDVTPVPPLRQLTPPGTKTWVDAVRRRRVDRSTLLERASRVRLATARALQYQTLLANPNPSGRSSAVYIYETAKRQAVAPTPRENGGGGSALGAILTACLAAVGALALVVVWAHS